MALDLDAIRKQVPEAQGWSDSKLMQYYYATYAQPRGMSWDTFAKSVGYEAPAAPTWRQKLDQAYQGVAKTVTGFLAQHPEAVTSGAPAVGAELATKAVVGGLDVAQAELGKFLGQGAADITATIGSAFRGTEDISEAAQAIESSPEMQKFGSTITPEGASIEAMLGKAGSAIAPHLPHVTEALEGEVEKHKLGPGTEALASVAVPAATLLLTSSNPLTRALSRAVSEPLQAAVGKGVQTALEKTEAGRTFLASRRAEDRLWQHQGQSEAITDEANQIASKWVKLPLTREDRLATYHFQEDPTGTFPLTDAQRSAYAILYPHIRDLDWSQGYVHRIPILTADYGPGRILVNLREGERPSLTPRVSLEEGATQERQMYKLVPVQEVTDAGGAAAAAERLQAVESEGDSGFRTDSEAKFEGIASKVKDIGSAQLTAAEQAEARAGAKLKQWQREDEEMAARRGGKAPGAPQAAPAGEPPVIAYVHRDDFMPGNQRSIVGIRGGQDFQVGNIEVSKDKPIVGQEITDPTGKRWRVEEASTREIEQQSRVVYHKDLGVSVAEAWRQHHLRVATESLLDDLKTNPDFYGLIQKTTGEDKPDWAPFNNQWLKGYRAPKRLQRTIDTLLGARHIGFENVGGMINTALLRANFIVNIWHAENIGEMGLTEAGARLLTPGKLLDVSEDWRKSLDEVMQGGHDYNALLRDGFPFMSRRTLGKDMYSAVIGSLVREVDGPQMRELVRQGRLDESTLKYLGDGLKGYLSDKAGALKHGLDMYEGYPIWTMDDMLKMRAVYARMRRTGEDLLTAGKRVKGDFPQYRLRYSTPGLGPLLDGMQRSGIVWFMPYHVDRLAILARRIGKAATLDPQAMGQLLATATLLTVVYPALDDAVQRATSNPKAHMERFGSERVAQQAVKVATHQAPIGSLLSLMITPSGPVEFVTNTQAAFKKGEQQKDIKEQALDYLGAQAGTVVYPFQTWSTSAKLDENLRNAFLSQVGVEGLKPQTPRGKYHPYQYKPPR